MIVRARAERMEGFRITDEDTECSPPELRAISFRPLREATPPAVDRPGLASPSAGPGETREDPAEMVWRSPAPCARTGSPMRGGRRDRSARSWRPLVVGLVLVAVATAAIHGAVRPGVEKPDPRQAPRRHLAAVGSPRHVPVSRLATRRSRRSTTRARPTHREARRHPATAREHRPPRSAKSAPIAPAARPSAVPAAIPARAPVEAPTPAGPRPASPVVSPAQVEFGFEHTGIGP
jgi:hypothetical protein